MKLKKNMDVLGSEIKPGDYIVYGAAKGRCAGLNIGKVVSKKLKESSWSSAKFLCVVAAAVVIDFSDYRQAGVSEYGEKKKPRHVCLDYSERICVIPESIVPDHIKTLLDY